jgi:RecA/RadA recombinase
MAFDFRAYVDAGREKFGDDRVLVGSQEEETQFGLILPSFAQQYIYHSNILPLSKIIGVAGPAASHKSAYCFEQIGQFGKAGGYGHIVDTENKTNMHYIKSVVGKDFEDRFRLDTVETVQEAQDRVSEAVEYYKKECPEKNVPFAIIVDSLMGTNASGVQQKISDAGHADKAFPEGALVWSQYFKTLCSSLIGQPISVFFTNHLKVKIDSGCGDNVKTKQGGTAQDFHAAQYLYMRKVADIRQVEREGTLISITSQKCGLGPADREILVPCLWDYKPDETGEQSIQTTWWDWHAATAKLLVAEKECHRVKKVSDVTCNANKYSSKRLGLSKVSDTELGEALANDEEYMKDLRMACGFRTWKVFGEDDGKKSK